MNRTISNVNGSRIVWFQYINRNGTYNMFLEIRILLIYHNVGSNKPQYKSMRCTQYGFCSTIKIFRTKRREFSVISVTLILLLYCFRQSQEGCYPYRHVISSLERCLIIRKVRTSLFSFTKLTLGFAQKGSSACKGDMQINGINETQFR